MSTDLLNSLNKNGSGIDLKGLATSLADAEIIPKTTLIKERISETEASISALGQVRSQLDKLSQAISAVDLSPFLTANSSNSDAVSVAISNPAAIKEGSVEINVLALATRQVLEFGGFTSADAEVGAGQITLEIGVWESIENSSFVADSTKSVQTISISAGTTLTELAERLSNLNGVTARILDKGDGTFSLGMVSETGLGSSLNLTVSEDEGTTGLSAFDTSTTISSKQVQAASDAMLEVDGVTTFRPSNVIDNLIDGVTLTLNDAGTSTINIHRDATTAATNLEYLVINTNETIKLLREMTARGVGGQERGALAGDVSARAMEERLRTLLSRPLGGHGDGELTTASLGISIKRDGLFSFDRTRFDATFEKDPKIFDAAFDNRLEADVDGVSFSGAMESEDTFATYVFSRPADGGSATFGGSRTITSSNGDGTSQVVVLNGPMSGLEITLPDDVDTMNVFSARSLTSLLSEEIELMLSNDGALSGREDQLQDLLKSKQDEITALDGTREQLTTRYQTRFTQMEIAITKLNSTSTYLTNLVAQWNKDS